MIPPKRLLEVSGKRAASIVLAAWLQTGALFLPGAGLTDPVNAAPADCAKTSSVSEISSGAFVRQGTGALPAPENGGAIANIGFIIGNEAVAVIDTGGSLCDGLALREAIRRRTGLPIKYIINTHVHPDHIFGNAAFSGSGTTIIGHRNLPRALAERGEHYIGSYERQIGAAQMKGTQAIPPDRVVLEQLQIDLGGRELVIEAHPAAHTDNDLSVFDKQSGILWAGDLVFLEHIPVLDGSLIGWLAVMSKLMDHEATRIVPGHGPSIAAWPEAGKNQLRYLERLAKDLRQAIGAGTGIRQTAEIAAESERDKWQLFDNYNRRNATTGYAELEWE